MRRFNIIAALMAFLIIISIFSVDNSFTSEAASKKSVKKISLKLDGVNVTKKTYTMKAGDKALLSVKTKPAAAQKGISYKSSNKKSVKLSKKGLVTAISKGVSKIRVTTGGKYKKKSVWVKIKVIDNIEQNKTKTENVTTENKTDTEKKSESTDAAKENEKKSETTDEDMDAVSGASKTVKENKDKTTEDKKDSTDETPTDDRVLVVYFSRTGENYSVGTIEKGNTAILAGQIAARINADSFEILAETPYPEGYEECKTRATAERTNGERPAYIGDVDGWDDYRTVFIGYPIWWGDMPMIVYNFIESHNWAGKTVIPFNTHEGSGQSTTQSTIKSKCQDAVVKQGIAIRGSSAQGSQENMLPELETWLNGLSY